MPLDMPMTYRKALAKTLDEALAHMPPKGKNVLLTLDVEGYAVVPRKFIDDVQWFLRSVDPDTDKEELDIRLEALGKSLSDLLK